MLPAGRRVAGKPRPTRVPLPQGPWGRPPGQPADSPSLCSGFFSSRPGSGRQIRRYLRIPAPKEAERRGPEGGPGRGAPSSRSAARAESKGSASSRLSASGGGGRGGGMSLGVGFKRVGGGSFLRPATGSRSGRGGETVGGSPGRRWRRRCRRRSRRGGCRCRTVAGATASSSGRDAERASESGGEEPGAHHSWIPHSNFKPRPRLSPAILTANRRTPPAPSRAPIGRLPWQ